MVNSPPRSVWSALNFKPDSSSAHAWISLIAVTAQSLEGITTTHMYPLRLSTRSKRYLLPLGISGTIGPRKSLCTSTRHRLSRSCAFIWNEVRRCFPAWHASHKCSTSLAYSGSPLATSSQSSFQRVVMLTCPKCSCQHHTTSSSHPRTMKLEKVQVVRLTLYPHQQ
jgi:hypothetical protein